jgi:hypothetical protein
VSLLEVGQSFTGLAEVEDGVHDRPDDLGVDEGGEFAELVAAGLYEQVRVRHLVSSGTSADPVAQGGHGQPDDGIGADLPGEGGVGWPVMLMTVPPGFSTRSDLSGVSDVV